MGAGSSRDVELVIRARDESTKAISAIADAMKILTGATSEAGQGAQKFDGLLGELGTAFAELQKQASGLQSLGTVAKQLDRASEAVQRLENATQSAGAGADALRAKHEQLAAAGAQLNSSLEETKGALEGEKAALAQSEAAHAGLNQQVERAGAAYRIAVAEAKAAKGQNDLLEQSYREQRGVLIALVETQLASEASLTGQRTRVAELTEVYQSLNKQLAANATQQERAEKDATGANERLAQSQATLEKARTELKGMAEAGQVASDALGGVALKQEAIGAASKATAQAVNEVAEALKRQTPGEQGASLGPAAAGTAAYRAQVEAVDQARAAFEQARQAATVLGQQMAATEAPTREMAAQFTLAKVAAAEARQAYFEQAQALNALKGVSQGSFAAFSQQAGEMQKVVGSTDAMVAGLRRLADIAPQAVTPLTVSIRELLTTLFKVPEAADAAGGGLRRMGEGSRESVSLFERLHGEVMSLTLSFFGLFGAIQAVGSVIHTVAELQAAQARLTVVFGGDAKATAEEMAFIKGEAERLGFSITQLAGEYTKVAIAGKEMGFSLQGTRTVFVSIAEAIRVAGGDASEADGIFQGLVHSIDRGTLNARNFNNQIGMRIPGSMKAMADAVGVTVQKFDELQRSGGGVVASEQTLVKFAENLRKEMSGALPMALQQINAELGRLQAFFQEAEGSVASGGFTVALKALIDDLENLLSSDGGAKAFTLIGNGLAGLTKAVKFVVDNFGLLSKAAEFFIGLKVAEYVLGLVAANGRLAASLAIAQADVRGFTAAMAGLNMEQLTGMWAVFRAQVVQTGAALAAMGADGAIAAAGTAAAELALGAMEAVMVAVTATARAMWIAVGGFPGLLIVGATILLSDLLGKWMTGVDDANAAIETTDALIQRVVEDYRKASDAADDFAKKAMQASTVQLLAKELELRQALAKTQAGPSGLAEPSVVGGTAQSQQKLAQLLAMFQDGKMKAADFKTALNDLATADPSLDVSVIAEMQDLADKAQQAETKIRMVEATLRMTRGTATDADKALLGLADAAKAVSGAFDATALDAFNDALEKLQSLAPDVKPSVKLQQNLQAAQQDFKTALKAAKLNDAQVQEELKGFKNIPGMTQAQMDAVKKAYDAYQAVVTDLNARFQKAQDDAVGSDSMENIRQRIWKLENAPRNPGTSKNPESSASGFGQFTKDTWLRFFDEARPALADLSQAAKLALRSNEKVAADVFDLATRHNQGDLARAGISPTPANTYLAHLLGSGGAIKVILANPHDIAAAIDPEAAKHNASTFYHRGANGRPDRSKPLTVGELEGLANQRMGGGSPIQASGLTTQDEFNAKIAELIKALQDAATAINQSPRDAFIQSKLTDAQHNLKPGDTFSDAQKKQVSDAAGASFDATDLEREKRLVAGLNLEINNLTKGEQALTREQYIAEAAAKDKIDTLTVEGQIYAMLKGRLYDLQTQQKAYNDTIGLAGQRKDLASQLQGAFKEGDEGKVKTLQGEIADITAKLKAALPDAIAFAKAMGDQRMLATLDGVQKQLGTVKTTLTDTKTINQDLASGLTNAFKQSTDALGKFIQGGLSLKGLFQAIGASFLNFAADFLQKIAEMIIQQELLNLLQKSPIGGTIANAVNGIFGSGTGGSAALTAAGTTLTTAGTTLTTAATQLMAAAAQMSASSMTSGITGGSGFSGLLGSITGGGGGGLMDSIGQIFAGMPSELIGLVHEGGLAGAAGGQSRSVWPGVFANARRMHTGGIAGLNAGEIPMILKKNEEVLTESDPRHAFNAGAGGAPAAAPIVQNKIVNAFDYGTVMSEALNTTPGQQAFVNFVRQNRRTVKSALG